jgi:signal peptidase II
MKPITRYGVWGLLIALAALGLDQASKAWIVGQGQGGDVAPMLSGPIRLTLVQNSGISYGLLQGGGDWTRWALAAFALIVSAVLAAWVWRAEKPAAGVAVGLILGGALGNVADRVIRGSVVDFVDARALHFPWIFNVADSAITVGIVILIADGLFAPRRSAA